MSSVFGYARLRSIDQDLSIQCAALQAAGCSTIRAETASGTSRNGRSEPETLMEFLQAGDTLVVTRIDRLARSLRTEAPRDRYSFNKKVFFLLTLRYIVR